MRTSKGHQEMSSFDVSELYGKESERFWSAEMSSVMGKIGGISGDVLGAAEQVSECMCYVAMSALATHPHLLHCLLWWA